jgi:hypothetical protein
MVYEGIRAFFPTVARKMLDVDIAVEPLRRIGAGIAARRGCGPGPM